MIALGRRQLAIVQGAYLLITGIWPLVSMKSFLYVTGPKTDLWLVTTVGLLLAVTGSTLISSGLNARRQPEFVWLGMVTAVCLAAIEIYFTIEKVISAVYLLDSVLELLFTFLWIAAVIRERCSDKT